VSAKWRNVITVNRFPVGRLNTSTAPGDGAGARSSVMQAIRIKTTLHSETLNLPELRPLLGKAVEIIVLEDVEAPASSAEPAPDWSTDKCLETAETFFGLAPPEFTPEEQAAEMVKLREMAVGDPRLTAFLDASERSGRDYDVDAVIRSRGMQ